MRKETPESRPFLSRLRKRWRPWLRSLHRDAGYLAVGLTVIYAISGLAINHIDDWNPNFETVSSTHHVDGPIPGDEQAAVRHVLDQLGIKEEPREAYRVADNQLEIFVGKRSLVVETDTGTVFDEYEEPRFFLRVANWLHYNRGKAAWTYIADAYAVFLLFLAVSGMFMLRGRLGLRGRGAVLIIVGASVPILYITLAGGPNG
ncbi:MAG: PepSY-associated TM helix domain-containing protein [Proteobacteria bacterium]|nr:PepSY-associated TM helix domain-containing protein [Pseudomonadota bacterium]